MFFQKGYFFRKIKNKKILILNLSIIILIICSVLLRTDRRSNKENSINVGATVYGIDTNKKIYSISVEISKDENRDNIQLISRIAKGFNVELTFFVTSEWIDDNSFLVNELLNNNHKLSLLVSYNKKYADREDAIEFLAEQNNVFFKHTEKYPSLVRIKKDTSGKISELIDSFRQKNISYTYDFNEEKKISEGCIVNVNKISNSTPFEIAELISYSINEGYTHISLEKLIDTSVDDAKEISQ